MRRTSRLDKEKRREGEKGIEKGKRWRKRSRGGWNSSQKNSAEIVRIRGMEKKIWAVQLEIKIEADVSERYTNIIKIL